uniref:N-acetylated alpha-linked acidic dipeptidase like 2 n=1 Tax=Cyprinus carpio TaxID=7962 RepID=A0A8C1PC14_CYPCA
GGENAQSELTDMAYRKVRAGHGSLRVRDLESEELHTASMELEWDMEKELEEPGLDRFQLECVEHQPVSSSSGGGMDPDLEPIQPSVSPHGRFERLQEDPNYVSRFSRSVPKGQRRNGTCLAKYLLAGMGVFALGLLIGRYAFTKEQVKVEPSGDTDVLEKIVQGITAEKIQALQRNIVTLYYNLKCLSDLTEESKVRYIAQRWDELGLKDVQVTNHMALLSYPGPTLSKIIDKSGNQCYLPSGMRCDQPFAPTTDPFAFAAYSAVGNLVAEVVDVQYGSPEDLRRVQASANVTSKIALLKLGQFPLLYKLSLLAEVGFGGCLLYVDPCDAPFGNKTFGVTLNPGGNPFSQDDMSLDGKTFYLSTSTSPSLCLFLIAGIYQCLMFLTNLFGISVCSSCLFLVLCVSVSTLFPLVDRYVLVGSRHGSWYEGALADWGNGSAVMTQIIASMTAQTRAGWQPDRTIVFCSWGGTSLGNIGSFEWGKENAVVLQSRAVAYVSLHSPVRAPGSLQATVSPSLQQLARHLMSCRGGGCPGPNVSSLQTPGDLSFFSNQLAVPTVEFTYSEFPKTERAFFLSEAFSPPESSLRETLDPAFELHENIAKITAEAILRLATDPVLPFHPLDIALNVQNKLKGKNQGRKTEAFPANDPKERDPSHVRMLNDVLRDLEKSFLIPNPPPGFSRNILYCLSSQTSHFSILKDALDVPWHNSVNQSLSLVSSAISSADKLVQSGLDLFENVNDQK